MPIKKKSYYKNISSIFNELASEHEGFYDGKKGAPRKKHTIWQYINRYYITSILDRLTQKQRFTSLLDAGCGMGDFTYLLGRRYHFETVHGIDFSDEMLTIARAKYNRERAPFLEFSNHDLSKPLVLQDNAFDICMCLNALHHILPEDQKNLINELCRVSKKLVIIEIKCFHLLWQKTTNYKALGYLQIYPTTIETTVKNFSSAGFSLLIKSESGRARPQNCK
jgi:ubiquinone/menaquinone biosynthesis C-methylase UbiE